MNSIAPELTDERLYELYRLVCEAAGEVPTVKGYTDWFNKEYV